MIHGRLITDNKWKQFHYGADIPQKVKAEYDHLDESQSYDSFLQYRGVWYHVSDFLRIDTDGNDEISANWDGYYSDSAFSAVLIQISTDMETYRIARLIV